jgi:hypothetical protein
VAIDGQLAPLQWVARQVITAGLRRDGGWSDEARARWNSLAVVLADDHPVAAGAHNRQIEPGGDPSESPGPGGIERLGALYGLDAVELRILAIALAPHVDANIGAAFALLTGRTEAGRPTAALAFELAGLPSDHPASRAAIAAGSRLLTHRLVVPLETERPLLSRTLDVPDRIVSYFIGLDAPDPQVARLVVDALPLPGEVSQQVAAALQSGVDLVWIRDRRGGGGAGAAVAAMAQAGIPPLVADLRLAPAADRLSAVAGVIREAALSGHGVVLLSAELVADSGGWAAIESAPVPTIAVGRAQWRDTWLPVPPLLVSAPSVTTDDRRMLWAAATEEAFPVEEFLAAQLDPHEILAAVRYSWVLSRAIDRPLGPELLRRAVVEISDTVGPSGARFGGPASARAVTFDDLIVPEGVNDQLRRLVRWALHRKEVLALGPIQGLGGKAGGLSAVFTGLPGTGKTLAAHVIAGELGLELLQVDLSAVVDKYIGETEKNLEAVFHEAESREVVLFFDEADALFGSRSEIKDARDRYANQEVSYLLQRLEKFDGIAILATNLRGNLDQAFTRRMQFIIHFGEPDQSTRLRLWAALLEAAGPQDPADKIDPEALAALIDVAGGDIRNIVMGAAYDAVSVGELVGMRHVVAAAIREFAKLGRRAPAGLGAWA